MSDHKRVSVASLAQETTSMEASRPWRQSLIDVGRVPT